MNTLKNVIRTLCRPAILAVVGLLMVAAASQAANMQMWVLTGGRWALIVPGSNTGGQVIPNSTYGWTTDRASRGEQMVVFFSPSTPAERNDPRISKCRLSSTAGR